MAIDQWRKSNFQTLMLAAKNDDLTLVECTHKETGRPVYVMCAMMMTESGAFDLVPLARQFEGNPYEELNPPQEQEYVEGADDTPRED